MKTDATTSRALVRCVLSALPLFAVACGSSAPRSSPLTDGSSLTTPSDGGQPETAVHAMGAAVDAMGAPACVLPPAPTDPCSALPTGKVTPCSQDGGQSSQTGYLEIDSPGAAPIYVCAT